MHPGSHRGSVGEAAVDPRQDRPAIVCRAFDSPAFPQRPISIESCLAMTSAARRNDALLLPGCGSPSRFTRWARSKPQASSTHSGAPTSNGWVGERHDAARIDEQVKYGRPAVGRFLSTSASGIVCCQPQASCLTLTVGSPPTHLTRPDKAEGHWFDRGPPRGLNAASARVSKQARAGRVQ
jgi:hypothetical protein